MIGFKNTAKKPEKSVSAPEGIYRGKRTVRKLWDIDSVGERSYPKHRIPGIVVTKKDTVIVYCEARTGNTDFSLADKNDWCLMDIYLQRSTDGGKTFGDPIYIVRGDETTACVNNPVIIVGRDNTLHLLYCKNYSVKGGGLWYRKSTDDGLTWTEEREVSRFAESVPHDCFAFGPTHGICKENGVLMTAVWLVPKGKARKGVITEHGPSEGYVFYSRDNGETWELSSKTSGNGGETDIALLSDGDVILNSRSGGKRKITVSPNGVDEWTETYRDRALQDPGCCAGLVSVNIKGLPYAHLFSNCATPERPRNHTTVKCSFDDCVTWEKALLLDLEQGGYSDIAVDSHGKVFVIYEVDWGREVNLVTMSYYDEFVKDDSKKTCSKTEWDLGTEGTLSFCRRLRGLACRKNEEGLKLICTKDGEHSFVLDFKSVTKNINLTAHPILLLRMRLQTANGEHTVPMIAHVRNGRQYPAIRETDCTFSVTADGQWQEAVLDFREESIDGMLHGIRLEVGEEAEFAEGDSLEISFAGFYEEKKAAEEKEFEEEDPENLFTTLEKELTEGKFAKAWKASVLLLGAAWVLPKLFGKKKD